MKVDDPHGVDGIRSALVPANAGRLIIDAMRGALLGIGGRAVLMLALACTVRIDAASQTPGVADVLSSAASYITDYERQISAVVSEERYLQRITGVSAPARSERELRSDMLVVADERWGWVGFRDVFEVDGRPVRDRAGRLSELFLKPTSDTFRRARRIMDEGARFNLNIRGREIDRNLNLPMIALRFIHAHGQPRSHFKVDGVKTIDDERLVVLRFQEHANPRMIESTDNAAAHGLFWIEPVSGRVVRSELVITTRVRDIGVTAVITTTFALQPKVGVWVPASMEERYTLGPSATIEGHATYTNFRKFKVDVETVIKAP
jgi:hypothetical protein